MKVGDLVVWKTIRSTKSGAFKELDDVQKSIYAIVIEMPAPYETVINIAKIMALNGKMYTVPLDSHYVLQVIYPGGMQ
tara:strand:- start:214 stop:447 length:234 start_codon:yes stop_codon:yes gene_type:complete